jgi:hypothetical protein
MPSTPSGPGWDWPIDELEIPEECWDQARAELPGLGADSEEIYERANQLANQRAEDARESREEARAQARMDAMEDEGYL